MSRRKFYDLLNNTDGEEFLAYYGERKLILRAAFEKYLCNHLYTHVGLEDAEKELRKMQELENARKEMGISDTDDERVPFYVSTT